MIDTTEKPRARVLLLAFMCSPDHGSEWANGWNRALQCAKRFDTWVICQGDGQAVEIERYLETHGPIRGLHFEFLSYTGGVEQPEQVKGLMWLTYNLWHRKAYRVARRLHEELHFDLVHQVTNTGFREPGYLWKLDAPFVWGPIGGTHNYPWRFMGEAGIRHGLGETVRGLLNSFQLNWSRRARIASHRASALLVANSTMQQQVSRVHRVASQSMLDVGISSVSEPAGADPTESGPLRILWSGQFLPRKALSLLLKALAKLPRDVDFELRVIGGGPMERRWKRLAERLGIAPRVAWPGWLAHKESLKQYAWADVFAFTSLRDNSGTVVLEALAGGLPVVCLDHQGARDIVTDRCGVKVAVTSRRRVVDDLRDAVTRLARDPALRGAMGRAARQRAGDYLWSRLDEQMTAVYRRVLAPDKSARSDGEKFLANGGRSNVRASNGSPRLVSLSAREEDAAARESAPAQNGVTTFPRSRFRDAITWGAWRAAAGLHAVLGEREDAGFGILMYHRVADKPQGVESPTYNVTPRRLREQLEGLLSRGMQAWPLRRILDAHRASRPIPSKVFAVTFDDGYENNFLDALPILKELDVPATVFLATAFLDSERPFPSDNWSAAGSPRVAARSWRPLSTAQCREMLTSGLIELGAHTHTHQFFLGRADEFRRDLSVCVEVLRDRFEIRQPTFAFPFGVTSPELVEAARQTGVECALTTRSECVRPGADPFDWGRYSADDRDTPATLAAKLSGWYTPVADVLRPFKRALAAVAPKAIGEMVTLSKPCFEPHASASIANRNRK